MKRGFLILLVVAVAPAGMAVAQQPGQSPYGNPGISPYLNLARPGNPGINYYALVRPQQQVDAYIQHQMALQQQSANAGTLDPNAPLTTGTVVRFQSQGSYFGTIRPTPVAPLPVSGSTTRTH